jgi:hypothetical protein
MSNPKFTVKPKNFNGLDGKPSIVAKAFFECSQILEIAQYEADINGLEQPDPQVIIDNYFEQEDRC